MSTLLLSKQRRLVISEDAYADAKVSAGLFAGEIGPSTCCTATVKLLEERVVQLFNVAVQLTDTNPLLPSWHILLQSAWGIALVSEASSQLPLADPQIL